MKELGGAQKWEDVGMHQSCENVLSKSWWGRWQRNKGWVSPTQPELQHITEQNHHVHFIFCLKPRLIVFYHCPYTPFMAPSSFYVLPSPFYFQLAHRSSYPTSSPSEGYRWCCSPTQKRAEWGLTCASLLVMLMELWGALGTTWQNHEAKQQLKPLLSSFQQSKSNFVLSWLSLVKIPIRNI